jgi:hypothetical protein
MAFLSKIINCFTNIFDSKQLKYSPKVYIFALRRKNEAIPFNIHTPLCARSIKFEPLRKKDQSADTNTPPEIKKFLPYPSEKMQRSKDADAHNPSETAFSTPLRNSRP